MNNFCSLSITDQDIDEFNIWSKDSSNYLANCFFEKQLAKMSVVDALKNYVFLFYKKDFDFDEFNHSVSKNRRFFSMFNQCFLQKINYFNKKLNDSLYKFILENVFYADFNQFKKWFLIRKNDYGQFKELFLDKKVFLDHFKSFLVDEKNQNKEYNSKNFFNFFKDVVQNKNNWKKKVQTELIIGFPIETTWSYLKNNQNSFIWQVETKNCNSKRILKHSLEINISVKKRHKNIFINSIFGFYTFFYKISMIQKYLKQKRFWIISPYLFLEFSRILNWFNSFLQYIKWSWLEDKFKNKCQSYYLRFKKFLHELKVNSIFIDFCLRAFFDNLENYLNNKSSTNILSCIIYNFVFIESLFRVISIYEKKQYFKISDNSQWEFYTIPREIELLIKFFLYKKTKDENNFTSKGVEYHYCIKDFKRNNFIHMNFEKLKFFNQNKLKEIYEILLVISFLFLECFVCNATRQLVLIGKVWSAWNMDINLTKKFKIPINFIMELWSASIKMYLTKKLWCFF